jgi:hypothetical protein
LYKNFEFVRARDVVLYSLKRCFLVSQYVNELHLLQNKSLLDFAF